MQSRSRRLEYWKSAASAERPWITYELVKKTVISESFYFLEYVDFVKKAGFNYRIIETVETIIEEG